MLYTHCLYFLLSGAADAAENYLIRFFFFCLSENTKMKQGQQLCHQGDSAYLTLNKPGCNCGFHFIDREASHLLEINKTNMCKKSCTFSRLLKINKVPELEIKT